MINRPFYIVRDCYSIGDITVSDAKHRVIAHFMNNELALAEQYVKFINESGNVETKAA